MVANPIGLPVLVTYGRTMVDQPGHPDFLLVLGFAELAGEMSDDLCKGLLIGGKRMVGDVQADQLAFPVEHLALVDIVDIRQDDGFRHAGGRAEQAQLPGFRGAGMIAADGDHAVERGQQGDAVAEGVQRADLDQALQAALADRAQVHPAGKIVQVLEGAILLPFFETTSMALLPRFLMAPSPKRMEGCPSISSISKSQPEALISGGRTGTPMVRASATYSATFSVSPAEAESRAAIYSAV